MSKLLGVVFSAEEAGAVAGFAGALGVTCEVVSVAAVGADAAAAAIVSAAGGCSHVVAVSSMASKDVMARVAGLLDAGMVTDVIAAHSPTSFVRPVVAGTVLATVEVLAEPVVLTFRPAGFAAAEAPAVRALDVPASAVQLVEPAKRSGGRPDLTQAKVIISGGRPMKDAETFERVIGGFADAVGGAAGATRAAVDSGIAPNELQVGQTGKIVAPDLYIAAGISGSTQHMAGIKDSKIIVAINKDGDAPIFESADLGLVADLYDALPELLAKMKG